MKACWANSYGNCGGGISGEHLISHGLFRQNKVVDVQGFSWCADSPKRVGIKSVTSNILCRAHNSALSLLDDTATAAFQVLREKTHISRFKLSPIKLLQEKAPQVNGLLLERWFLKTTLNLTFGRPILIGPSGTVPGIPPADLVEIVFGARSFLSEAGLSLLAAIGMPIQFGEEIHFIEIHGNGRLMGAIFSFFGAAFLLWLGGPGDDLPLDALNGLVPTKWGKVEALLKSPTAIRINMSRVITVTAIEFLWDSPIVIRMPSLPTDEETGAECP